MRKMKSLFLGALVTLSAFISGAMGQESVDVPFSASAALNTDFEGAAWKGAGKIEGFHKMGSSLNVMGLNMSEKARERSTVYLLHNNEALFFGFDFHDSAPDGFENGASAKGEWPQGDRVEIFLDGDRAGEENYYHLVYNASGARAESFKTKPVAAGEWQVVNEVKRDGWRSAIRIPYAFIGLAQGAELLKGLFFRDYHPASKKGNGERATWGGAPLHVYSAFGELKLLKEGAEAP